MNKEPITETIKEQFRPLRDKKVHADADPKKVELHRSIEEFHERKKLLEEFGFNDFNLGA